MRRSLVRKTLRFLPATFFLAALCLGAQDLSSFLSRPPEVGAWGRYNIETRQGNELQRKILTLSVTGAETLNGKPFIWLEVGRTNFAGFKNGYLRILLKQNPTPAEAANPFLAALAIAYQEPGKAPFALSNTAVAFMHNRADKIKITQKSEKLDPEQVKSFKGKLYDCTRVRLTTTTSTSFFGFSYQTVEQGTYWLSPETPFQIVKGDIERVETERGKKKKEEILILLRKSSFKGAKSRFTKPVEKTKGLLGILFH